MSRRSFTYALGGGLDEAAQPLTIDPGRVIACINHESVDSGYARVGGFERFSGKTSPTDYPFHMLAFTGGATAFVEGNTVLGGTSGATGIVLALDLSAGAWDGTGEGEIGLRELVGTFQTGEQLLVSGTPYAEAASAQTTGAALSGDAFEETCAEAARDYARTLIEGVPGSGNIRGVWEYGGAVYAFRDNTLGTAGGMYQSSATGWLEVDLGFTLDFTSGGTTEIVVGDVITGATSGAVATVMRVVLQSGDWDSGTAAGYFALSGIVGVFQAENLDVNAVPNLATIAAAPDPVALPAGGRYFFETHNFYGASSGRRMYGVNGVGAGFEFDGTTFVPIRTGMATDTPTRIAVYRNHLFFAFPHGSVQHSSPGEPTGWEAILGASEIGIGSDVADFIANIDSLIILGEHGIFALTGYDVSDWQLGTITREAGALPFTGQHIGSGLYLDNRGLRSIEATQRYGNFAMGTMSQAARKTMRRKALAGAMPLASAIVRTKNHYRLFYDDGTGLSFYLGRKFPEPMYFDLGKVVCCISSNESADDVERIFFGSTDGMIYQLDAGTSFDGAAIEAFCQLAYTHMKSPGLLKRVFKVDIEAVASAGTSIGIAVEYDYSRNEQSEASTATAEAEGAGGLYGVTSWGEFYWSSPTENILSAEIEGQGRNASVIAYSNSALFPAYELRGATIYYGERGNIR